MNAFVAEYQSVIWVTLSYLLVYYAIVSNGLVVKLRVAAECKAAGESFERYTGHYPQLLASDRAQLNTLEHMPPFFVLLWLQALMVSASSATILGAIYVGVRASYPFFLGARLNRNFPRRVLINTFSGYGVLIVFAAWQVRTLLN